VEGQLWFLAAGAAMNSRRMRFIFSSPCRRSNEPLVAFFFAFFPVGVSDEPVADVLISNCHERNRLVWATAMSARF
jgi:hypothetical protein